MNKISLKIQIYPMNFEGGAPAGACTRRAQTSQIVNFVEDADTCAHGYYCVTTVSKN
jgi:hypothetical protein